MSRTGPFFGELYFRSTLPFLRAETTEAEVAYLQRAFSGREGVLLDLGCGHGRHARPLAEAVGRPVVGVDFDPLSLSEAGASFSRVCADFHRLPFARESVGDAFAWYSTLLGLPRESHRKVLEQLHAVLRVGALFVVQTIPVERLLDEPSASFDGALPDGSVLHEESRFDVKTLTDHGFRRLRTPDARVLSASYAIHYYPADELVQLFESMGFSLEWVHGALDGSPLSSHSRDLIVGVKKAHG